MRENAYTKGMRYLTEHRLTVHTASPTHLTASVRGAGAVHHVTHTAGVWTCTCPARGHCSHLAAAQAIYTNRTLIPCAPRPP